MFSQIKLVTYMKPRSKLIISSYDIITKTYKRGSEDNISEIDSELKHIADNHSIGNRTEYMKNCEAFNSLKDHNENFENNPKCRLINPAKSDSEKISKLILGKINTQLRTILNVNQWRNTQNVIDWFGNIKEKLAIPLFRST